MQVLVVNIGSTSFKFRLMDMPAERELTRGAVDGVTDHAAAIEEALAGVLADPALRIDAIGFKAVHGGPLADAVRVTPEVIGVMEAFREAAPAHNPPYIAAMQAFADLLPDTPQVAAFETGFHETIPEARRTYAIPHEWTTAWGVRRYGFHGASHRYVAARSAELLERDDLRIVSCHLGGSSSVCAIANGYSVANSFGMTPQTGLPQNNRVGDFDPFALPTLTARSGLPTEDLLARMAHEGGLLGISGVSPDMAKILAAASDDPRARLAVDVFVESVRHYLGAYVVALGGIDLLTFTGGIGQNSPEVRARVCAGLEFLGIALDARANAAGGKETTISSPTAPVPVLVLETNEELIVARQTHDVLRNEGE